MLAAATAGMMCVAATAVAEPAPRARTIETGFGVGVFVPSAAHELYASPTNEFRELDPGPLLSWRAAYLPIEVFGAEVEIDVVRMTGEGDAVATVVAPRLHAIVQLPRRLTPFAVAGAGVLGSASEELGDDADPMIYAGIGAKYYWRDRVSLRADARVVRSSRAEEADEGQGTNHYQVSVGVAWTFGGAAPAPVVVPAIARDTDGDGITDDQDACPDDAETKNGVRDDDGCPETPEVAALPPLPKPAKPENEDGDIVVGGDDLCPQEAEDADGFEDGDGCPEPDNDRDGILDAEDKCPNEAETPNAIDDEDGCPDEGEPTVVLASEIRFEVNDHTLDGPSTIALDRVAALLVANPRITKVRIEGHSDDQGSHTDNILLSTRRANRVREYLVEKGVAEERLEAHGFGPKRPVASNATEAGRAKNRRVEIAIEQINGVPVEPTAEVTK